MTTARGLALHALARIEDEGAYANLALPALLSSSSLEDRDRRFATELVYGVTRMRRACDFLVDRFVSRELDPPTRRALRLGAYQLHHLQLPAHAAVDATVSEVNGPSRGLVNAVLRKVATAARPDWPDEATRMSYPDWIVSRLTSDLGADATVRALEHMNLPPPVTERADGYVQDRGSQLVAEYVDAKGGDRVADLCAAPGGKATYLAGCGAELVVATDINPTRAALISSNASRLRATAVAPLVADARRSPHPPRSFDSVLVDAPCSGLGTLRRRPDARWRIEEQDVDALATLQRELLTEAVNIVRAGGTIVYSVCTLTTAETVDVVESVLEEHPSLRAEPPPPEPWEPLALGARLLPHSADTDGMYVLKCRVGGQ